MDSLFPIKFEVKNQEEYNSVPINVPFTYQNECYIVTQEDHKDVYLTRKFTINKWNPCFSPQICNYNPKDCTPQLSDVIHFMMNALAQEQQKQMQNQLFQQFNQPLYQRNPNENLINFSRQQFMQNDNHIKQTFHYDRHTSTDDLKYYQKSNQKNVRFAETVDYIACHSRGTEIDSDLLGDVKKDSNVEESNIKKEKEQITEHNDAE